LDRLRKRFSEAQIESMRKTVAEVEARTSGEVVPMVVGRSDPYPEVAGRSSLGVCLLGAASTALAFPHLDPYLLVISLPVWALLGRALALIPGWVRLLAGSEALDEEVHQRALQAFVELDLSSTQGRSGVLIFFSLLEHRVEIIADRGIYEKVNRDIWVNTVRESTALVRKEGVVSAVNHAVESVGKLLATHFPRSPGDRNEIPDRVVIVDA
jgi:putative membrane protein